MDASILAMALGTVGALLGLALVIRSVALWYWRINRIVALLESIDESLRALPAVRDMRAAAHRRRVA